MVALVVLSEYLHAVWRLPPGDADYPTRWSLIKAGFSRPPVKGERSCQRRAAKRESGIRQRRYWEQAIPDEADLMQRVDHLHFNPVKHSRLARPVDRPCSTLPGDIDRGWASRSGWVHRR